MVLSPALHDILRFSTVLNARKVYNFGILSASYFISKVMGKPFLAGLPDAVSIEPTTSCNLRCPECPSGLRSFTRPTGMLDQANFQSFIDQVSPHLTKLTLYFQGEPYLNPGFLDMVAYARKKKIYVSTSTNAHYLNEEQAKKTVESGLDRLTISIDGTTQETYEQYRIGGKLEKVLEGTKELIRQKKALRSKTPYTIFQFLVVKPNEHQVAEVRKLAKTLGVDKVVLKTAQIYDFENGSVLMPENSQYSRYKLGPDGKYQIKNEMLNQCWRMWHSCVLTWDGRVLPCCFDKDGKYQMGNAFNQTFAEIWRNKAYNTFRSSLLISRKEIDICTNCTEGTRVWA